MLKYIIFAFVMNKLYAKSSKQRGGRFNKKSAEYLCA